MKLFKKLASFILAFAMVAAIAMPSVVMAADSGSITITGAKAGHTFEAYQIFAGDYSNGTLSNIKWGTGVNSEGQTKLGSATDKAATLQNENDAKKFAYEVAEYLDIASGESVRDGENYKINNLAPGYYLVKDKDGTVPVEQTYTQFILKVVGDATAAVKSKVPTSEKKVKDTNDTTGVTTDWQDSADYDIGDDVPFQLTGTVAEDFADYKGAYKLVFHDKESAGLKFKPETVKVYVDGNKIDSGYDIKTKADGNTSDADCTFEVVFDNLKKIDSVHGGSKITVEYKSTLTTDAVIGAVGNPNEMQMEFSNNPNVSQGGTTTTPWDKVIVFTYQTIVNKQNSERQPLTGAGFTLYKKVNGDWEEVTKVLSTSNDGATFTFAGLDDGDYKLAETTTPPGYNTMAPIEFTIEATHDTEKDNPELTKLNGNVTTGTVTFTPNIEAGSLTTDVINYKGSELPETGGMGTTVLYVAGTLMIIVAAAFLVMKKKAENK